MRSAILAAILLFLPVATGCIEPVTSGSRSVKKVYSRDEFRKIVQGKTPDEVIVLVGRPEFTEDGEGIMSWFYHGLTRDPYTGKMDDTVLVNFEYGRASGVTY